MHLPHMHYDNSYCYPGTHDNETCTGWFKDRCASVFLRARACLRVCVCVCVCYVHIVQLATSDIPGLG